MRSLVLMIGVCLGTGAVGLVTAGPSVELLVWTVAPLLVVFGLHRGVCAVVRHYPDFAKIRAEDERAERLRAAQRAEDALLEQAAREQREAHERSQGQISVAEAVDGKMSMIDRGPES